MRGLFRSLKKAIRSIPIIVPFRIVNLPITVTDPGAAVGYGAADSLIKLPQGNILLLGAVSYLQFSSSDADLADTWTGNYAIGTAATADATLNGNEVNIIPSTAISAATAKLSPVTRGVSTASIGGTIIDNTDGSLAPNINLTVADASLAGNASIVINGIVYLVVMVMGDD